MPRISRYQLVDAISELNDITSLDSAKFRGASPDDLFLCALGFEQRCLQLPRQLEDAGYRSHRAYYFTYATNLSDNAVNLPELKRHLLKIAPRVEPIESDEAEFPNRLRALLELAVSESSTRCPRITLDISVTANRLLLRCIKVLLEYDVNLRIVYSEAAVYHPTEQEYQRYSAKWGHDGVMGLEQGVSDVMPSIDHPGIALDPLPASIILFPSFNVERSKAVIGFVDPSLLTSPGDKIVWLLGIPHHGQDHWRLEAIKTTNGILENVPQHRVSTFDYKDTLRTLELLYTELAEKRNITLSPLGSKMQALGTAIFCYMHPDVRLIFAMPKEYNASHYSKGCKAVWQIELGSLKELRNRLDKVGTLFVDD